MTIRKLMSAARNAKGETPTNPAREKWIREQAAEMRAEHLRQKEERVAIFGYIDPSDEAAADGEFEVELEQWIRDRRRGIPEG